MVDNSQLQIDFEEFADRFEQYLKLKHEVNDELRKCTRDGYYFMSREIDQVHQARAQAAEAFATVVRAAVAAAIQKPETTDNEQP